jgi:hypothetical protein
MNLQVLPGRDMPDLRFRRVPIQNPKRRKAGAPIAKSRIRAKTKVGTERIVSIKRRVRGGTAVFSIGPGSID